MFYQNRPFNLSYNNQNAFYNSPTGLYRPTMESSTSSLPNQPYSPINPTNLDMNFKDLMFSQEYNYSQDYSMGHGSGHGSAPDSAQGSVPFHDDEDDSPIEEVSPIKPKKPSRRASKAKKNEPKEVNETPKEWTVEEEIALCQGEKKSKTSETNSGSASGGLNFNEEADEAVEETQEFRPMGRDRAKAKKKAAGSSRGGASSFVDLAADNLSPLIRFRSPTFEYNTQLPQPPQKNNMFYQNRPFNLPYNNQNAFYNSPTGLYRPTMESSMSSLPNQPYSPLNPTNLDINFEDLMFSQEYNYSQDYSMGHGSGHGSALDSTHGSAQGSVLFNDDEDDSSVEEVSPIKPKKPSRRASKAKKNEPKEVKETPKEWTVEEEIALCQGWCDILKNSISGNSMKAKGFWEAVIRHFENETGSTRGEKKSKTSETTSGSASGGLNLNEEADEAVEESQEFRPMGRDRAKAKKKAAGSSHGGASSFVYLAADKFYNMKQKNGERRTRNNRTNTWGRFELRVHKHVIDLFSPPDVVKQITSITIEPGVEVEVKVLEQRCHGI
uniref:40S ribosomal protein S20-2 n=1 Tax=Tanacetum cinerariifolium TaxID=118510 RepID=A0A699HP45_TANCI|nr:40S ribosomal protein S20-2 [Tanacetum cinerariifolium]